MMGWICHIGIIVITIFKGCKKLHCILKQSIQVNRALTLEKYYEKGCWLENSSAQNILGRMFMYNIYFSPAHWFVFPPTQIQCIFVMDKIAFYYTSYTSRYNNSLR